MKKHIANYKDEIKSRLDSEEKYREMLFRRGYLLSDKEISDTDKYPFYGIWRNISVGKYNIYV